MLSLLRILGVALAFSLLELGVSCLQPISPLFIHRSKIQDKAKLSHRALLLQKPSSVSPKKPLFEAYTFAQPVDHFSTTGHTFKQRYWVSNRYYKPGGPVIVFETGESAGEERFPILDTGIIDILAKETDGLGMVLEHRYYGESLPCVNFTTDCLRWLNNAQAVADSANFIQNVKVPGIKESVTAPDTPWIYYGGSYGGARAAHMKILYPDIVYAAIASSAVTNAIINNYEYFEIIADYGEPHCISTLRHTISRIDSYLADPYRAPYIKSVFGVAELSNEDFASLLTAPLGSWQGQNWDSEVAQRPSSWDSFCKDLTWGVGEGRVYAWLGVGNFASWIKKHVVDSCPQPEYTIEDCFGTKDPEKFQDPEPSMWRAWTFQVCTEWGYFSAAPPYPSIVSRFHTIDEGAKLCQASFPNGEHFIIPAWPNVTIVNGLGDYAIATDRLALIDGEWDPWRPRTPHSSHAPIRNDTILQPFKQIPTGVHHYDENGLRDPSKEPLHIQKIHQEEIDFVKTWLHDFFKTGRRR